MSDSKVFVVILLCRRYIQLPAKWIENSKIGVKTQIFFSPNQNAAANFDADKKYLFDKHSDATYDAYVCKCFSKYC